jgi:hypothetical protein
MCLVLQACAQSWTTWRAAASARPPVEVPAEPGARPRGAEGSDSAAGAPDAVAWPETGPEQNDDSDGERDVARQAGREGAAASPATGLGGDSARETKASARRQRSLRRLSRRCPAHPRHRPWRRHARPRCLTCGGSLLTAAATASAFGLGQRKFRGAVEKNPQSPCLRAGPGPLVLAARILALIFRFGSGGFGLLFLATSTSSLPL